MIDIGWSFSMAPASFWYNCNSTNRILFSADEEARSPELQRMRKEVTNEISGYVLLKNNGYLALIPIMITRCLRRHRMFTVLHFGVEHLFLNYLQMTLMNIAGPCTFGTGSEPLHSPHVTSPQFPLDACSELSCVQESVRTYGYHGVGQFER